MLDIAMLHPDSATRRPRRLLHDNLLCAGTDLKLSSRTALISGGVHYTFGQLLEAALRLANELCILGVQRGDRVAIYLDNSWPCVVSVYAALIAGAAIVLINPQTKKEKLGFILKDSGARVLISTSHLSKTFISALSHFEPAPIVICSGEPIAETDLKSFEAILAEREPLSKTTPAIPLDLAAIIYTSGSTGHPKGVMQTHQSMMFAAGSLIEYLRLTAQERILCVLPLAFDYGLYQLLMAIELGACLVLERSFTYPAQVYDRIRDDRISVFPGLPTIFATLIATHRHTPLSFPTVTRVTNTAAALPEEFVASLREIFPAALIYKMYGLTECKRASYLEPELIDAKPGSVGRAIPGTELYLLSEDGRAVAPGEPGILYVRGPHVMAGYWNRPDLTENMLKPGKLPGERVLCTQDIFCMDSDGFLYFVGRTDDIIKTRGQKVSPIEVEAALHRIPGVLEAAVVGIPDPLLGETIRAYVVTDPAVSLNEKLIRSYSARFLENIMIPTQVVFCNSLPKNPNGKINKLFLIEQPRS